MYYAYMNRIYSSRAIETACLRDVNFMWLLEGKRVPDHTTITHFRSLHLAPCAERIMAEVTEFLYQRDVQRLADISVHPGRQNG